MRERRRRAAEILDRLAAEHPDAHIALHWSTPLDLLVATILSAQSTDVGVNRVEDATRKAGFRLVGDVDFAAVRNVAGALTPNPGGVGPMTIAMLMQNTARAAEMSNLN